VLKDPSKLYKDEVRVPPEMTERRQLILKLVIQEYIESPARSVSSEILQKKYRLQCSTATIRNEMAALEDLGLLTHPHTSAGRLPTDAGYRYFVENLMDRQALSPQEQRMIQHQFYQVRGEFDQWIHLAAAVLARTARNAALVMPPRAAEIRFKHLELISIYETMILMVLVLHDGTVRQQSFSTEQTYTQEEISTLTQRLNERLDNATLARLEQLLADTSDTAPQGLERDVLELIGRAMRQLENHINRTLHHDGLLELLQQPEFEQAERIRQALEILQEGSGISPLIPQALQNSGVQVVIGGEHGQDNMREYSVVLSRYGREGEIAGVVGLFGPTRMAYPRSISSVRYISDLMSELLAELYGERQG
jgi:heat-inducible transcriptional repressor